MVKIVRIRVNTSFMFIRFLPFLKYNRQLFTCPGAMPWLRLYISWPGRLFFVFHGIRKKAGKQIPAILPICIYKVSKILSMVKIVRIRVNTSFMFIRFLPFLKYNRQLFTCPGAMPWLRLYISWPGRLFFVFHGIRKKAGKQIPAILPICIYKVSKILS